MFSQVEMADIAIVLDDTLFGVVDVKGRVRKGGTIIINSDRRPEDFSFHGPFKVRTVNATEIAVQNKLGSLAAPIVNTAIAGAVIKILGLARLESLAAAIRDGVPIKAEDNVKAAREAYDRA